MPRLAPQGYASITEPGKAIREADTMSCAHCNRIVHVPVNRKIEEVGDFCRSCMKVICLRCADLRVCTPLMRRIEQAEERDYRRNQLLRCG
jgi:hypothetical protein